MAGAVNIDVRFDPRAVLGDIQSLSRDLFDRITVQALNRAAAMARTAANREIREQFALPSRTTLKRMSLRKASRATLAAQIRVKDYDPPLARFSPRWKQRQKIGASIQFRPKGGRQFVAGAFTAVTKGGGLKSGKITGVGVYRREGLARTPIKFLRSSDIGGPTLSGVFLESAVQRAVATVARVQFEKEFTRLAKRRLSTTGGQFARLRVQ
jgi:hypothetical protein